MKTPAVPMFDYVSPKNGHLPDALEFIEFRLMFVEWVLHLLGHANDGEDDQQNYHSLAEIVSEVREAVELVKQERNRTTTG